MRLLCTWLALSASPAALAAGWADFEASFPMFPCHDGWSACIVDGDILSPDVEYDREGRPLPSTMRFAFIDLEPTRALNPFAELSPYTGEAAPAPEPARVARVEPAPAPRTAPSPRPAAPSPRPAAPSPRPRPAAVARPAPSPAPAPMPPPPPAPEPAVADAMDVPPPPEPAGPPPTVGDCEPRAVEPMAMLGKLTDVQIVCLEASLKAAPKMTDKNKFSRALMINAYSKGDKRQWESLVKRHLEEIDQSDPDLCYKYATHLAKKGPSRASAVIRWSNVALENRTAWSGDTYKKRVYALYKMKGISAQNLWRSADEKYSADPTESNQKGVEKWRNLTKVYAREWLEYAKGASMDSAVPLELCNSAAGHDDYCEQ